MSMPTLSLTVLEGMFAVARLDAADPAPQWASGGELNSVTRTGSELSIVCPADRVPAGVVAERDWCCLAVAGPLDFSAVGILAALTGALADAGVSLFALSTYDTDYLLVRRASLETAVEALRGQGHSVSARGRFARDITGQDLSASG